jgi:hypothetical protein
MGSQVPFMLASPNMEVKSQLLSLKKPLKHGLYSLESKLNYFMQKKSQDWVGRWVLSLTSKKIWSCGHPCRTWNLVCNGEVPTSKFSMAEIAQIDLK